MCSTVTLENKVKTKSLCTCAVVVVVVGRHKEKIAK